MELALSPGEFIGDHACFSFVSGLEEVAAKIKALTRTDAARAAGLYETFFAGCHAKTEELHDSSGSFGQFAQGLNPRADEVLRELAETAARRRKNSMIRAAVSDSSRRTSSARGLRPVRQRAPIQTRRPPRFWRGWTMTLTPSATKSRRT